MLKNITKLFLIGIMCLTFNVLNAQDDTTINSDDLRYHVGSGANEVIFIANWNEPDTALAWGYRFDGETVSIKVVMDEIAASDARFSYDAEGAFVTDLHFNDGQLDLSLSGYYWMYLVNGMMAMNYFDEEMVKDGDYIKWGDESCGTLLDPVNYVYVWTKEVAPVYPVFAPKAGDEGSTAIHADSEQFVAWATGCVVERGLQQIDNPSLGYASYGDETAALGKADGTMSVVSLGDGGNAVLTFEKPITNGEGPDFAVFENSFDDYFLELAFVEVSSDGVNFFRFPAYSVTQTQTQIDGYGQVDCTKIHNLAGKYRALYGTPFDLDDIEDSPLLDKEAVTHVRIVDVIGTINPEYASRDADGHIINDPWSTPFASSGFDLDAVGVIHQNEAWNSDELADKQLYVYPNPADNHIVISGEDIAEVEIYDIMGRRVYVSNNQFATEITIDTQSLPNGVHIVRIIDNQMNATTKEIVVRH